MNANFIICGAALLPEFTKLVSAGKHRLSECDLIQFVNMALLTAYSFRTLFLASLVSFALNVVVMMTEAVMDVSPGVSGPHQTISCAC